MTDTSIPKPCESCGAALRADAHFCDSCGHPVPEAAPAPPPPPSAAPAPAPTAAPPPPPAAPAAPPPPSAAPVSQPTATAPAAASSPSRTLLIGLGVLAGVLFLVGILGFAIGGGGDSGEVSRLERKEAKLKVDLRETRDATSFTDSSLSELENSIQAFDAADNAVHDAFSTLSKATGDATASHNAGGGAAAYDAPALVQAQQAYAAAVAESQVALDALRAALAQAQEVVQ